MKLSNKIAILSALQIIFGFGFSVINGNIATLTNLFLTLMIFLMGIRNSLFRLNLGKIWIIIPLSMLIIWHSREQNITGLIVSLIQIISICLIISLRMEIIKETKAVFLKFFSVVSAVSLFFWILYLFGISFFSSFPISYSDVYELQNHIVFIKTADQLFMRFQCLFVEPGLYGMLCVISLILNDFRKDKKSFIYILSALFSLSLATYLLLLLSFIYMMLVINRIKFYVAFLIIGGFTCLCVFLMNYKGGDNIVNEAIFFRLQLDDDNKMVAYNRATLNFEDYYERNVKDDVLLFGIGSEKYSVLHFEDSVDVRAYITLDGLVGLTLFLLFYLLTLRYSGSNKFTVLMIGVYLIIFLRGYVFSFSYGGLLLFIVSMASYRNQRPFQTKLIRR